MNKTKQSSYHVTLRRVSLTFVTVEMQKVLELVRNLVAHGDAREWK